MIFQIPVTVQPWFWVVLAFLSGQLTADSFPSILLMLLFLVAGFFSILVHELGHGLTAQHFGKRVEIVLQAFGGYAAYSGGAPLSRRQSLLVTAAGPGLQILLGVLAFVAWRSLPHVNANLDYFFKVLAIISVVWAVLNLLPVLPLDGGRLVESALGPERRKTTLLISCIVGGVICLIGLGTGQLFLAVFLGMFAYQSFQELRGPRWN